MRITLAIFVLLCGVVVAYAQIAGSGAHTGPRFSRELWDFGMGLGGSPGGGGVPPPVGCSGVADMSDGCAVVIFN